MTTLDTATLAALRQVLYAYLQRYGQAESVEELRAIAGSILSVKEKAEALVIQGLELETWVQDVVQDFDVTQIAEQAWDQAAEALAVQTKLWRDALEVKVRATVDAYIQTYVPHLDTTQIQNIVTAALPIVEDAHVSRDEAMVLMRRLSDQVDPHSTVGRLLDPKWITLAGRVKQLLDNQDLTDSVQDIALAYVHKFKPVLADIGEELIEDALSALLNSSDKLNLDIDIDLAPDIRQLMVRQVSFKMQMLEASPIPSKPAMDIAMQMAAAVARYRRGQGMDTVTYAPDVKTTDEPDGASVLGGELGVGIEIQPGADLLQDANEDEASPQN